MSRKRLTGYAILALMAFLFLSLTFGWTDVVFRPWAKSVTGAPLLLGTWTGEMPVPGAVPRRIVIELQQVPENLGRGQCANCARIEGTLDPCVPGAGAETFSLRGDPGNWRGTVFRLNAAAPRRSPGVYLSLGEITGEWDRGDLIRLRAKPYPVVINADGSSTVSSDGTPEPEVHFELRRGGNGKACG